MKTMNEKAKDYADSLRVSDSHLTQKQIEEYAITDFLAGYKATQEWISIDDELPPKEIDRKLSIDVLCKLNDEEIIVSYYNFVSKTWNLNNNKNTVTHWRLIEIN